MNKRDRTKFKKMLLSKRTELVGELGKMEEEALRVDQGDLSHFPSHIADMGSDIYEQEFMLGLLENGNEALLAIDAALLKIEDGTFGVCETCERDIGKERLTYLPHAKLCIECQREAEAAA